MKFFSLLIIGMLTTSNLFAGDLEERVTKLEARVTKLEGRRNTCLSKVSGWAVAGARNYQLKEGVWESTSFSVSNFEIEILTEFSAGNVPVAAVKLWSPGYSQECVNRVVALSDIVRY